MHSKTLERQIKSLEKVASHSWKRQEAARWEVNEQQMAREHKVWVGNEYYMK